MLTNAILAMTALQTMTGPLPSTTDTVGTHPDIDRSFRGVWVATVYDSRFSEDLSHKSIDGIRDYWRSILDAAERVNVNAVFFQVRPCADTFYKSELEPWSLDLRGEQGQAPEGGFDPLQFMIDECHARGMQLHAWFNPFRVTYNDGDEKKLAKTHNYYKHPDWFVKYGRSVYYDPGVPDCRDWTVKVVMDVASRYDIDGIHIDDYFYPYPVKDDSGEIIPFPDDRSFKRYGGAFKDINDWRDDNCDRLVAELSRRLRALKPDIVFGVAPFNDNDYCVRHLHCDTLKWAKNGWIDYMIPQLYYGEKCRRWTFWWDSKAKDCALFAGRFLKNLNQRVEAGPRRGMSEFDNMVETHSQMTNLAGVCWWSAQVLMQNISNVTDRIAAHYSQKTLVPLYRDRPRPAPAAVTDARAEKRGERITLTWRHPDPIAPDGSPRAVFTAVFRGDERNPVAIVAGTTFAAGPSAEGKWRLVALDRLQNAAAPTTVMVDGTEPPPPSERGGAGAPDATCPVNAEVVRDVPYDSSIGRFGLGDLYLPEKITPETPVVLAIHGGGWRAGDRHAWSGVAEFLRKDLGCAVFNIEYRLASAENRWPACGDDCVKAANWLFSDAFRDVSGISPGKIFICGGSAGGHLALWTLVNLPPGNVAGVISISSIGDPSIDFIPHRDRYEALLGAGETKSRVREMNPIPGIRPGMAPVLCTHAVGDTVVPIASHKAFATAYRAAGNACEFYEYPRSVRKGLEGHCIYVPGSNPHRLIPEIETRIAAFMSGLGVGRDGAGGADCGADASDSAAESWFGAPIPASGYDSAVPDCGMSAAAIFDSPVAGLERIGTLAVPKSSDVPASSNASIGFEGLDRGLFNPNRCYDALAAAGVKWARVQTMWSRCEKEKGKYDFSVLDGVVENLSRRGIRPWFSVTYGNTLYMTNCHTGAAVGCVPTLYGNECRAAWCAYVRELARRYKGKVTHWEIWNEPNIREFWQPTTPNAAEYLELVKLTGGVIREEIPGAKIGGTTSSPALNDWERKFFELGGAELIDFWCGHAYGCVPERLRHKQKVATESTDDYVAVLRDVRSFIDAKGGSHIEIWQGESGFPSWFPEGHWLYPKGVCKEGWQSQANQAKWMLRRYVTDRRAGISRSSFYQMADISRHYSMSNITRKHPAEHGILNGWTFRPKMAYHAFGNYNALLATAKYDGAAETSVSPKSDCESPTVSAAFISADGSPILLYYTAFDFSRAYTGSRYVARTDAALTVPATLAPKDPVLIDMLRGGVYALSARKEEGGRVTFLGLPLVDYPLAITERENARLR